MDLTLKSREWTKLQEDFARQDREFNQLKSYIKGIYQNNQREPKLTKYDGSISWTAFEAKLNLIAEKYQWDKDTKLMKFVEVVDGKALEFFSTLTTLEQNTYRRVSAKFETRFGKREDARTARNKLHVISQKKEEPLAEFAERTQWTAQNAWGREGPRMVGVTATEAFLHGIRDQDAALTVMNKKPENLDEAAELVKEVIQNRLSLEDHKCVSWSEPIEEKEAGEIIELKKILTMMLSDWKQHPRRDSERIQHNTNRGANNNFGKDCQHPVKSPKHSENFKGLS